MMKQAKDITSPTVPGPNGGIEISIDDNDRIDILEESSSKDSILLLKPKKELLLKFVSKKSLICDCAALIDVVNNSTLEECLTNRIPDAQKAIKTATNKELATLMVSLYEPLQLLHSHLQSQEHEQLGAVAHLRARSDKH